MNNGQEIKKFLEQQTAQYKEYLNKGGEPVSIKLELHPWDDDGLEWTVKGTVPEGCRTNPLVLLFTNYIREQIIEACKPPLKIKPGQWREKQ